MADPTASWALRRFSYDSSRCSSAGDGDASFPLEYLEEDVEAGLNRDVEEIEVHLSKSAVAAPSLSRTACGDADLAADLAKVEAGTQESDPAHTPAALQKANGNVAVKSFTSDLDRVRSTHPGLFCCLSVVLCPLFLIMTVVALALGIVFFVFMVAIAILACPVYLIWAGVNPDSLTAHLKELKMRVDAGRPKNTHQPTLAAMPKRSQGQHTPPEQTTRAAVACQDDDFSP
eukprot:GHVT01086866.1.p1 GENE.GHVT01086866.1~~GHVT01086866.1.p1  ORF type:complete len:231 (-),score=46.55 GHVT01086866.1:2471-3163(-)